MKGRPGAAIPAAISLGILALNAAICWPLFGVEYLDHLESNEGIYIALGRFVAEHWRHFSWQPLFDAGSPFEDAYFSLTPFLIAAATKLGLMSPAHAFHIVAAVAYCLGPVFLFWFAREVSERTAPAAGAALLWSLCSPSLAIPYIWHDMKTLWGPYRLRRIVVWGEAPHQLALSLLPLALFLLARYWKAPDWKAPDWKAPDWKASGARRFAAATLGAAAVILANAFGIVGIVVSSMLLFASVAFERGAKPRWVLLVKTAAVVGVAYLLISRFLPPSLLWLLHINSEALGVDDPTGARSKIFKVVFLLTMAAAVLLMRWLRDPMFRFAMLFFALFGSIGVAGYLNAGFLPQPHRYVAEGEMGCCLFAAFALEPVFRWALRNGDAMRIGTGVVLAIALAFLSVKGYLYSRGLIHTIDISQTAAYKEARWIGEHVPGQRVMIAGMNGYWFNLFADNPQLGSAHEASDPNWIQRVAVYTIYSGQNAGDQDGPISELWLKAFGCGAIAVAGPGSQDPVQAMVHPAKFDGLLPLVWREGGDSIYQVPLRSTSLAHVIPAEALVTRQPAHGLDVAQVRRYVAALEDATIPQAPFTWDNPEHGNIVATMAPGQVVSVQVTYDAGWRARVAGRPVPVRHDELGFLVVDPQCSGECSIELKYEGGWERRMCGLAGIVVGLALLGALWQKRQ